MDEQLEHEMLTELQQAILDELTNDLSILLNPEDEKGKPLVRKYYGLLLIKKTLPTMLRQLNFYAPDVKIGGNVKLKEVIAKIQTLLGAV